MGLVRTGYEQHFEEICPGNPMLGRACVLPWDTETFGFPVAAYQTGADQLDHASRAKLSERFASWAWQNQVQLCVCTIPTTNGFWKSHLPEMRFKFVDFALQATVKGLQAAHLPETRTQLRSAQRKDWQAIEDIAARAFSHGRYHADPIFPRELADLRYRQWVRRALESENGRDRVYVMGDPGSVQGFCHITVEGEVSDLRLIALSPELRGNRLGLGLYTSMLHLVKSLGVESMITSISAGNTEVMNVHSFLGFRFSEPEAIYHWHREKSEWATET